MFWSDWGATPKIMKAGMDGREVTNFVTTEITWPNGLALDRPMDTLYWVDAKLDRIESIHIDGTSRRV
jgi:sugar lactone lactonase YvrE